MVSHGTSGKAGQKRPIASQAGHPELVEGPHPELSERSQPEPGYPLAGQGRHPEPVEGSLRHFTSPEAAVQRATKMLKIERTLGKVSDSLFDTIVVNEVGPATSLAARMLGDYRTATDVVHVAFEHARSEFSSYDGTENPRSWVLGYVAEEAVRRSSMQADAPGCEGDSQSNAETALHCLRPESRLAVILTDVLGMTDEAAARVARVDLRTVRRRAAFARSWIARHLNISGRHDHAPDGAPG